MSENLLFQKELVSLTKGFYTFQIQPQDVDFQYRITLSALTNILLTTAGFNADDNGFGIRNLNQQDCSWVLLRLAVEMDYFPLQYEKIHVETWVETVSRVSTTRNFRLKNEKGEVIGYAVSIWAMINIVTRRAQDLISLEGIHTYATGIGIPMERPMKLLEVSGIPVDEFIVKYSHIDINGHTSSMRYVEWISNCFSLEKYTQKQVKRFEINYITEILFGEVVAVYMQEFREDDFRFEIRKQGLTACRARVLFK